MVNNFGH